jgi:hypothetical protein
VSETVKAKKNLSAPLRSVARRTNRPNITGNGRKSSQPFKSSNICYGELKDTLASQPYTLQYVRHHENCLIDFDEIWYELYVEGYSKLILSWSHISNNTDVEDTTKLQSGGKIGAIYRALKLCMVTDLSISSVYVTCEPKWWLHDTFRFRFDNDN